MNPWDDYGQQQQSAPRLVNRYGWQGAAPMPMGTIVRGILHAGSLTLFYGLPKSGKSFLVTDLFVSIAAGCNSWMDHPIVRNGPVLYVACEGHAGFWKRLQAKALHEGWDKDSFPPNFVLAIGRPMLIQIDPDTRTYLPNPADILAAIDEAAQHGCDPIAVAVDTVFRSFGPGNVNASDHMNAYLQALTSITDQGKALAAVHHETKAGGTPIGSQSLLGGADTIIRTDGENGQHSWQVEAAKDDAVTEAKSFSLEVVQLGLDLEGQPATSCRVVPGNPIPKTTHAKNPAGAAGICLRALDIALAREGALLPPLPEFPTSTLAVPQDLWRDECYRLKAAEPELNRKTFNRGQDALLAQFLITQRDGYVWKTRKNGAIQ